MELNKRQELELAIIENKRQAIKLQLNQLANREKEILLGKHSQNLIEKDDDVLITLKRSSAIALGLIRRKH